MDMMQTTNKAILCGTPTAEPVFSHISRQTRFYTFPMEVARLSGNTDRINVILREELLAGFSPSRAGLLRVDGELRSFNNRSGEGSRLVITVFARELGPPEEAEWVNEVELTGALCKPPNHRVTPMGREICDLMVAVNRHYGRSDYLPCIAWGHNARAAAFWDVGQRVHILGRIQSREYVKNLPDGAVTRTAFEVSVTHMQRADEAS